MVSLLSAPSRLVPQLHRSRWVYVRERDTGSTDSPSRAYLPPLYPREGFRQPPPEFIVVLAIVFIIRTVIVPISKTTSRVGILFRTVYMLFLCSGCVLRRCLLTVSPFCSPLRRAVGKGRYNAAHLAPGGGDPPICGSSLAHTLPSVAFAYICLIVPHFRLISKATKCCLLLCLACQGCTLESHVHLPPHAPRSFSLSLSLSHPLLRCPLCACILANLDSQV